MAVTKGRTVTATIEDALHTTLAIFADFAVSNGYSTTRSANHVRVVKVVVRESQWLWRGYNV
jgi:hypothetical protein